jgi:predicted nucleic-acid-binding Zn-ribbon protein
MKCKMCHKEYPSKYYFVTESICQDCFDKMDNAQKQKLLDEKDSLLTEEAAERTLEGHKLKCPVCGNKRFWKRKTLMNTPGATFFGVEWANRQAINFVCDSCGYVLWFLRENL